MPPQNPLDKAFHPTGPTGWCANYQNQHSILLAGVQTTKINHLHLLATQQGFHKYLATNLTLKAQLIAAISPIYIQAMNHNSLGFTMVTC